MDYFEVFGLERRLQIDVAGLEKAFYAQSRRLHPDRFAARPAEEQEAALAESSRLNDAYRTLKDPILRTKYLLQLEGVEMEEQSKAATEAARASGLAKKQSIPADLLEEVFELNMELMEMKAAEEVGRDADPQLRLRLETAAANFDKMRETSLRELEHLWAQWDRASDEANRGQVKAELVNVVSKWSYLRNLTRDVGAALA